MRGLAHLCNGFCQERRKAVKFVKFAPQGSEARKQFFFEKKNQKTFALYGACRSYVSRHLNRQKFFGSFFQKRTASSLLPGVQWPVR
jgi:hypothetical protein